MPKKLKPGDLVRAHKTCDTVHQTGGRCLDNCVHLKDQRCDGGGHDGYKATCLLFWKTEWLRSVPLETLPIGDKGPEESEDTAALEALSRRAAKFGDSGNGDCVYHCQATALFDASQPLAWYDPRQYEKT